jgi:thymidylate synthase
MRIFKSLKEVISEVGRDLVELGVLVPSDSVQGWEVKGDTDFDMKEITGYAYRLSGDEILGFMDLTEAEASWVQAESIDRTDECWKNPGRAWNYRGEIWRPMLVKGRFDYTYNERLRTQLPLMIEELKRNPNSRQTVLLIYQEQDQRGWGGRFRVPCSLSYQFIIRDERLHLIYSMRSCDYFNHFKFDVLLALNLQDYVASELELSSGTLTHFIGSLHCFRKDWEKAGVF